MWLTFIITFIVFLLAAVALAAGLLISGKTIKGSCGGINCQLCKNSTKETKTCSAKQVSLPNAKF